MLLGRQRECGTLDGLLRALRAGESRALVVRGEPGMGKSALLEYVHGSASGCRVARACGVQSEMELAFAGLHLLCAPMLDRLDRLPEPQRAALQVAFGLSAGVPPDRFFVGLAILGLLADVAEQQPLVCLVDDAQWLDEASAHALAFVARRLSAESVALFIATRTGDESAWSGVPQMALRGLGDGDAMALLRSAIPVRLDEQVLDRIVAETHGNPLALLELPRGLTPAQLAGGFGLESARALSGHIEESFRRRLVALPRDTQLLLLIVAADPVGEPMLVWRAAEELGISPSAAAPAADAGLAEFGGRVRFRHPLVRSAVYEAASAQDRRRAHRALAEVTDPENDPDRRAWHRAHAAPGPHEEVAAELEHSAGRAQARGGLAAEAAFLAHAADLSVSTARRARRCLAAAEAQHQAGAPDAALSLLSAAEVGPLDELERARVDLLHAQVAAASGDRDAPTLLEAARRLEPLDLDVARQTYLDALCATVYGGPSASRCEPVEVARSALAAVRPGPPRAIDLLLDGLALKITEGYAEAAPTLRRALDAFKSDHLSVGEGLGWGWLACYVASTLYEHHRQKELAIRQVRLAHETGALMILPNTLAQLVGIHLRNGELGTAAALMQEVEAAVAATGGDVSMHLRLALAVFQGREAEAQELIDASNVVGGGGFGGHVVLWGSTLLYNSLGRYRDAMSVGLRDHDDLEPVVSPQWARPELIEAAVRCGSRDLATDALRRLSEITQASGTGWALGLEARSRALLSEGVEAERLYRQAIEHLTGAGSDVDLMRAHLLFGEWLRREGRRVDARRELRTAAEGFRAMGVQAFADRATRELMATGETVRKRSVETVDELTAQERQIARLARDGLSNPEIGARLFLSPRTVEWHLRKVFGKLGIRSRHELAGVLPSSVSELVPA